MADGDENVFNAVVAQQCDTIFKKGLVVDRDEGFGNFISEWSHFNPFPASQDNSLLGLGVERSGQDDFQGVGTVADALVVDSVVQGAQEVLANSDGDAFTLRRS